MLGVDFNSKSVAEMSLQYLSKPSDPPPSYNSQARRAAHDYLQNEQSNIDNKTQQQDVMYIIMLYKIMCCGFVCCRWLILDCWPFMVDGKPLQLTCVIECDSH